jgi:hypothetical protein
MKTKLDEYLEEIEHYLSMKEDTKETLAEIRSHLMEKIEASDKKGDEAVMEAIQEFGSPQTVAESFQEENHIINPAYRKFLFRYVWIVFAIHFGLKLLSFLLGRNFTLSFFLFEFSPIADISNWQDFLLQIPTTFIYDFGITAFVFYFISQNPNNPNMHWPTFFRYSFKPVTVKKPKAWLAPLLLVLFILFYYRFQQTGTIFYNVPENLIKPNPVYNPEIFHVLSIIFLVICAIETVTNFLLQIFPSLWIKLLNSIAYLFAIHYLFNLPKEVIFPIPALEALSGLLTFVGLVVALSIIGDVIRILRSMFRASKA